MKRVLVFILFLAVLITSFILVRKSRGSKHAAALIHLHVENPGNKEITVLIPVNRTNYLANKKIYHLNTSNECAIELSPAECGLLIIRSDNFYTRLLVASGDEITLNIKPDQATLGQFEFKGDNAAGHSFFRSLKRNELGDVQNPYRNDTSAAAIEQKIETLKEKEIRELNALLAGNKITATYATFAAMDINYYYAASLADAFQSKFLDARWAKLHKGKDTAFKKEYAGAWKRAFEKMPLNMDKAPGSRYFAYYADSYFRLYKGEFLNERAAVANQIKTAQNGDRFTAGDLEHLANYKLIDKLFNTTTAEYLKALYLQSNFGQRYDQGLVDIFHKFEREYPHSAYMPFLKEGTDLIVAYLQSKEQDFSPDQLFWPGAENITSVSQLLTALKGNAYYVDIWSTYCVPCKEEFRYNASLQRLLKNRNVRLLYLSIDDERRDDDWKNLIKYFKLSGLHVRAADELRKDLSRTLGKDNIMSIPRYLIIDKNGTIINNDAARPSDSIHLSRQISGLVI